MLRGAIAERTRELIRMVCSTNDVEILAGHVGTDHIHLLVSVPPHLSASKLVQLRAKLAYFHAQKYGPLGYLDAGNFSPKHQSDKFNENIEREIQNNSKALFVKHHLTKYNGEFPIWVIVELFTLGMISRFYADMTTADKKELAKSLYATTPKNLVSWLRCVTDLRNICAHYGRLYYRIFTASPAGFSISESSKRRLWGSLLALKELYPEKEKWNHETLAAIETLVEEYCGDINLYHIAFPNDWKDRLKK